MLRAQAGALKQQQELLREQREALERQREIIDRQIRSLDVQEVALRSDDLLTRGRLQIFLDSLPIVICRIDREQRYRIGNAACRKLFKTSPSTARGDYIWNVLGERLYDVLRPAILQGLDGTENDF